MAKTDITPDQSSASPTADTSPDSDLSTASATSLESLRTEVQKEQAESELKSSKDNGSASQANAESEKKVKHDQSAAAERVSRLRHDNVISGNSPSSLNGPSTTSLRAAAEQELERMATMETGNSKRKRKGRRGERFESALKSLETVLAPEVLDEICEALEEASENSQGSGLTTTSASVQNMVEQIYTELNGAGGMMMLANGDLSEKDSMIVALDVEEEVVSSLEKRLSEEVPDEIIHYIAQQVATRLTHPVVGNPATATNPENPISGSTTSDGGLSPQVEVESVTPAALPEGPHYELREILVSDIPNIPAAISLVESNPGILADYNQEFGSCEDDFAAAGASEQILGTLFALGALEYTNETLESGQESQLRYSSYLYQRGAAHRGVDLLEVARERYGEELASALDNAVSDAERLHIEYMLNGDQRQALICEVQVLIESDHPDNHARALEILEGDLDLTLEVEARFGGLYQNVHDSCENKLDFYVVSARAESQRDLDRFAQAMESGEVERARRILISMEAHQVRALVNLAATQGVTAVDEFTREHASEAERAYIEGARSQDSALVSVSRMRILSSDAANLPEIIHLARESRVPFAQLEELYNRRFGSDLATDVAPLISPDHGLSIREQRAVVVALDSLRKGERVDSRTLLDLRYMQERLITQHAQSLGAVGLLAELIDERSESDQESELLTRFELAEAAGFQERSLEYSLNFSPRTVSGAERDALDAEHSTLLLRSELRSGRFQLQQSLWEVEDNLGRDLTAEELTHIVDFAVSNPGVSVEQICLELHAAAGRARGADLLVEHSSDAERVQRLEELALESAPVDLQAILRGIQEVEPEFLQSEAVRGSEVLLVLGTVARNQDEALFFAARAHFLIERGEVTEALRQLSSLEHEQRTAALDRFQDVAEVSLGEVLLTLNIFPSEENSDAYSVRRFFSGIEEQLRAESNVTSYEFTRLEDRLERLERDREEERVAELLYEEARRAALVDLAARLVSEERAEQIRTDAAQPFVASESLLTRLAPSGEDFARRYHSSERGLLEAYTSEREALVAAHSLEEFEGLSEMQRLRAAERLLMAAESGADIIIEEVLAEARTFSQHDSLTLQEAQIRAELTELARREGQILAALDPMGTEGLSELVPGEPESLLTLESSEREALEYELQNLRERREALLHGETARAYAEQMGVSEERYRELASTNLEALVSQYRLEAAVMLISADGESPLYHLANDLFNRREELRGNDALAREMLSLNLPPEALQLLSGRLESVYDVSLEQFVVDLTPHYSPEQRALLCRGEYQAFIALRLEDNARRFVAAGVNGASSDELSELREQLRDSSLSLLSGQSVGSLQSIDERLARDNQSLSHVLEPLLEERELLVLEARMNGDRTTLAALQAAEILESDEVSLDLLDAVLEQIGEDSESFLLRFESLTGMSWEEARAERIARDVELFQDEIQELPYSRLSDQQFRDSIFSIRTLRPEHIEYMQQSSSYETRLDSVASLIDRRLGESASDIFESISTGDTERADVVLVSELLAQANPESLALAQSVLSSYAPQDGDSSRLESFAQRYEEVEAVSLFEDVRIAELTIRAPEAATQVLQIFSQLESYQGENFDQALRVLSQLGYDQETLPILSEAFDELRVNADGDPALEQALLHLRQNMGLRADAEVPSLEVCIARFVSSGVADAHVNATTEALLSGDAAELVAVRIAELASTDHQHRDEAIRAYLMTIPESGFAGLELALEELQEVHPELVPSRVGEQSYLESVLAPCGGELAEWAMAIRERDFTTARAILFHSLLVSGENVDVLMDNLALSAGAREETLAAMHERYPEFDYTSQLERLGLQGQALAFAEAFFTADQEEYEVAASQYLLGLGDAEQNLVAFNQFWASVDNTRRGELVSELREGVAELIPESFRSDRVPEHLRNDPLLLALTIIEGGDQAHAERVLSVLEDGPISEQRMAEYCYVRSVARAHGETFDQLDATLDRAMDSNRLRHQGSENQISENNRLLSNGGIGYSRWNPGNWFSGNVRENLQRMNRADEAMMDALDDQLQILEQTDRQLADHVRDAHAHDMRAMELAWAGNFQAATQELQSASEVLGEAVVLMSSDAARAIPRQATADFMQELHEIRVSLSEFDRTLANVQTGLRWVRNGVLIVGGALATPLTGGSSLLAALAVAGATVPAIVLEQSLEMAWNGRSTGDAVLGGLGQFYNNFAFGSIGGLARTLPSTAQNLWHVVRDPKSILSAVRNDFSVMRNALPNWAGGSNGWGLVNIAEHSRPWIMVATGHHNTMSLAYRASSVFNLPAIPVDFGPPSTSSASVPAREREDEKSSEEEEDEIGFDETVQIRPPITTLPSTEFPEDLPTERDVFDYPYPASHHQRATTEDEAALSGDDPNDPPIVSRDAEESDYEPLQASTPTQQPAEGERIAGNGGESETASPENDETEVLASPERAAPSEELSEEAVREGDEADLRAAQPPRHESENEGFDDNPPVDPDGAASVQGIQDDDPDDDDGPDEIEPGEPPSFTPEVEDEEYEPINSLNGEEYVGNAIAGTPPGLTDGAVDRRAENDTATPERALDGNGNDVADGEEVVRAAETGTPAEIASPSAAAASTPAAETEITGTVNSISEAAGVGQAEGETGSSSVPEPAADSNSNDVADGEEVVRAAETGTPADITSPAASSVSTAAADTEITGTVNSTSEAADVRQVEGETDSSSVIEPTADSNGNDVADGEEVVRASEVGTQTDTANPAANHASASVPETEITGTVDSTSEAAGIRQPEGDAEAAPVAEPSADSNGNDVADGEEVVRASELGDQTGVASPSAAAASTPAVETEITSSVNSTTEAAGVQRAEGEPDSSAVTEPAADSNGNDVADGEEVIRAAETGTPADIASPSAAAASTPAAETEITGTVNSSSEGAGVGQAEGETDSSSVLEPAADSNGNDVADGEEVVRAAETGTPADIASPSAAAASTPAVETENTGTVNSSSEAAGVGQAEGETDSSSVPEPAADSNGNDVADGEEVVRAAETGTPAEIPSPSAAAASTPAAETEITGTVNSSSEAAGFRQTEGEPDSSLVAEPAADSNGNDVADGEEVVRAAETGTPADITSPAASSVSTAAAETEITSTVNSSSEAAGVGQAEGEPDSSSVAEPAADSNGNDVADGEEVVRAAETGTPADIASPSAAAASPSAAETEITGTVNSTSEATGIRQAGGDAESSPVPEPAADSNGNDVADGEEVVRAAETGTPADIVSPSAAAASTPAAETEITGTVNRAAEPADVRQAEGGAEPTPATEQAADGNGNDVVDGEEVIRASQTGNPADISTSATPSAETLDSGTERTITVDRAATSEDARLAATEQSIADGNDNQIPDGGEAQIHTPPTGRIIGGNSPVPSASANYEQSHAGANTPHNTSSRVEVESERAGMITDDNNDGVSRGTEEEGREIEERFDFSLLDEGSNDSQLDLDGDGEADIDPTQNSRLRAAEQDRNQVSSNQSSSRENWQSSMLSFDSSESSSGTEEARAEQEQYLEDGGAAQQRSQGERRESGSIFSLPVEETIVAQTESTSATTESPVQSSAEDEGMRFDFQFDDDPLDANKNGIADGLEAIGAQKSPFKKDENSIEATAESGGERKKAHAEDDERAEQDGGEATQPIREKRRNPYEELSADYLLKQESDEAKAEDSDSYEKQEYFQETGNAIPSHSQAVSFTESGYHAVASHGSNDSAVTDAVQAKQAPNEVPIAEVSPNEIEPARVQQKFFPSQNLSLSSVFGDSPSATSDTYSASAGFGASDSNAYVSSEQSLVSSESGDTFTGTDSVATSGVLEPGDVRTVSRRMVDTHSERVFEADAAQGSDGESNFDSARQARASRMRGSIVSEQSGGNSDGSESWVYEQDSAQAPTSRSSRLSQTEVADEERFDFSANLEVATEKEAANKTAASVPEAQFQVSEEHRSQPSALKTSNVEHRYSYIADSLAARLAEQLMLSPDLIAALLALLSMAEDEADFLFFLEEQKRKKKRKGKLSKAELERRRQMLLQLIEQLLRALDGEDLEGLLREELLEMLLSQINPKLIRGFSMQQLLEIIEQIQLELLSEINPEASPVALAEQVEVSREEAPQMLSVEGQVAPSDSAPTGAENQQKVSRAELLRRMKERF